MTVTNEALALHMERLRESETPTEEFIERVKWHEYRYKGDKYAPYVAVPRELAVALCNEMVNRQQKLF